MPKIQLPKQKIMTGEDLKHALISLVIGILTMAAMQLVNGIIDILQQWIVAGTAGTVSAVSYMAQRTKV